MWCHSTRISAHRFSSALIYSSYYTGACEMRCRVVPCSFAYSFNVAHIMQNVLSCMRFAVCRWSHSAAFGNQKYDACRRFFFSLPGFECQFSYLYIARLYKALMYFPLFRASQPHTQRTHLLFPSLRCALEKPLATHVLYRTGSG